MPKLKLKGMKLIRSDTTTNDSLSNDGPDKSASLPDAQPCCSIHSSSVDSNHNEEDANQDNGNILENVEVVTNVNTVDSTGRHTKRDQITLKELWALPPEERVLVGANHLGQPIGPEAQLLFSFLRMLARSSQRIGVQYETWHKVPKTLKEELLNFIELRFVLEVPKDYVLKSLGKKWRDYKYDLKKLHFKREDGLHMNKEKHPEGTIRWQWEELVEFWYSNKGEEESELVGKEQHDQVRGHGLGLTPTSYYGYSSSRNTTASSSQNTEFIDRFHQLEQRIQQMEKEREQERAQYDALVTFLQNKFPGANIPIPDIGGPTP